MLSRGSRKRELIEKPPVNQQVLKRNRYDRLLERKFKKRKLQEVLDELCLRVKSNDRQLTYNLIRELDTEHVRVISDEDFESSCSKMIKACLATKIETVSSKMFACLMGMFARGTLERRRAFVISLQNVCEGLANTIKESVKIGKKPVIISQRGSRYSDSSFDSDSDNSSLSETLKEASRCSKRGFRSPNQKNSRRSCDSEKEEESEIEEGELRDEIGMDVGDEEISMIDALFLKPILDRGVLLVYTMVLKEKIIQANEVPEKIKLCARRSLARSSLSSTPCRTAAIKFHVALAISTHLPDDVHNNNNSNQQMVDCEALLTRLSGDRDFRVRKAVAEGLLALSAFFQLSIGTYSLVKTFIKDTDSSVRIAAIKLLISFANIRGAEMYDGSTLISDDAFSAICDAMNDIEVAVRVEAAKKLGDFETVSEDLIFQTLDKKMMRSTVNQQVVKVEQSFFALSKNTAINVDRRWKFAKKAPKVEEARGGWTRGKELNAVAPTEGNEKKDGEEDEESIIPHGACGAFVSALEDEFMDVRKAAVYSLGRLASTRPTFAVSALEYLADMFNDEIADVRLDAIIALTPLISHGQLNSEQLNVISKCLDDAMPEARQAMRELLKRAQFVDVNCIEICVKALLSCLKRFPKDKEQIYSCMADIGKNHAVQVQSIMRSLLNIHLIFHTRESSIEDQEYVGKLIMVLNAASATPSMVHFMPEFVHRHYRFLRNSFPNLVRAIRMIDEEKEIGRIDRSDDKTNERAGEVLIKTYNRLCDVASTAQLNDRNLRRDEIFRDTSAIALYNSSVSGAARLIFCLGEVSSTVDSVTSTVLYGGELTNMKQLIAQSIEDMQSIKHQFSGISAPIHSYLVYCRVYLSFLDMLVWMMQVMAPQHEVLDAGQLIIQDAKQVISEQNDISGSLTEFLSTCESIFMPPIQASSSANAVDEKRKVITPTTLVLLLNRFLPKLPLKFPPVLSIHLKYAKITNPNKDTAVEEVLKFFALLPHGIPLEFDLYNMKADELDTVRIRTIYPDGKSDVMKPRLEEFRVENDHISVTTQVKVTCSAPWSEPAEIDVVIGIMSNASFVSLFSSPSCFSPAHVRVKIHPQAR